MVLNFLAFDMSFNLYLCKNITFCDFDNDY